MNTFVLCLGKSFHVYFSGNKISLSDLASFKVGVVLEIKKK